MGPEVIMTFLHSAGMFCGIIGFVWVIQVTKRVDKLEKELQALKK